MSLVNSQCNVDENFYTDTKCYLCNNCLIGRIYTRDDLSG